MTEYIHTVDGKTAKINIIETENPPQMVSLDKKKHLKNIRAEYFLARKIIVQKLDKAAQLLPQGYQFGILEAYRSQEKQIQWWQNQLKETKSKYPYFSQQQIEEEANNFIANPYKVGSGHQTGGAIDITLLKNGKMVDMGTDYLSDSPLSRTDSIGLTAKQQKKRQFLKGILSSVGLVNYPLEWWHYSYGEQEWAVITKHRNTLFASVKLKQLERE